MFFTRSGHTGLGHLRCPTSCNAGYGCFMRRPDPISLEETFLLFLLVIPMGYYAVWWLLAMIAAI